MASALVDSSCIINTLRRNGLRLLSPRCWAESGASCGLIGCFLWSQPGPRPSEVPCGRLDNSVSGAWLALAVVPWPLHTPLFPQQACSHGKDGAPGERAEPPKAPLGFRARPLLAPAGHGPVHPHGLRADPASAQRGCKLGHCRHSTRRSRCDRPPAVRHRPHSLPPSPWLLPRATRLRSWPPTAILCAEQLF